MSTSTRRAARSASLVLALALVAGGCRDGDDPGTAPAPGSESSAPAVEEPVRTTTTVGTVTGRLAKEDRRRVVAVAGDVVDRWFDAAYVGSPRPRVGNAFAAFTSGARARARRDRTVLTNQELVGRVDSAAATRRRVRVDVLAVRGRAVGLTARFALDLATTGKAEREVALRGRLLLTPTGDGWKVFGYDVSRGGGR